MYIFFRLPRYKKGGGGGQGHIAKVDLDGFHLSVCVFALYRLTCGIFFFQHFDQTVIIPKRFSMFNARSKIQ